MLPEGFPFSQFNYYMKKFVKKQTFSCGGRWLDSKTVGGSWLQLK